MEPDTKSRRAHLELRALLDISYGRERALISSINALLWLTEGAAFAAEKQGEASQAVAHAKEALASAAKASTPNHGLFLQHLLLAAEVEAARQHIQSVTQLLHNANAEIVRLRGEWESAAAQRDEAVIVARKLSEVVANPELTQRVADVVHQLLNPPPSPEHTTP